MRSGRKWSLFLEVAGAKQKAGSDRECCHTAKLNYPLQWTRKTQAIFSGQRFKSRHSKQRLKVLYNPSLRERNEDIGLPVDYFVQKISKQLPNVIEGISAAALDAQSNYHWPGNIRELENILARAVMDSSGHKLYLVDELKNPTKDLTMADRTLEDVKRKNIVRVLEQTKGKVNG